MKSNGSEVMEHLRKDNIYEPIFYILLEILAVLSGTCGLISHGVNLNILP